MGFLLQAEPAACGALVSAPGRQWN